MYFKFTQKYLDGNAIINRSEILDYLNAEAERLEIRDQQSADILFRDWCMGYGGPSVIYEEGEA